MIQRGNVDMKIRLPKGPPLKVHPTLVNLGFYGMMDEYGPISMIGDPKLTEKLDGLIQIWKSRGEAKMLMHKLGKKTKKAMFKMLSPPE